MLFDQSEFEIRCEWGENGVIQLAPHSDVVVIVDVFSFSTCVEIATARGAQVFPYRWLDEAEADKFAASVGAEVAARRRSHTHLSLSPESLLRVPAGTRLVLPSPNGATLSLGTGNTPTLAGCLRNYAAVAAAARKFGKRIAVIPAGERWKDAGLRPAVEDWIGAGAIINQLDGSLSPEARAARAAFRDAQTDLENITRQCGSAKELIERGFARDVQIACEQNVSDCVPVMTNGAYVRLQ